MAAASGDGKAASDWVRNQPGAVGTIPAEGLAGIVRLIAAGHDHGHDREAGLRAARGRSAADPAALVAEHGLASIGDSSELEGMVDEVLAQNPQFVEQFRAGKEGVINALVGQVMKQTRGRADARQVQQLLRDRLSSYGDCPQGLTPVSRAAQYDSAARGRQALPDHPGPDSRPARGRRPRRPRRCTTIAAPTSAPCWRETIAASSASSRPSTTSCSSPARARPRWSRRSRTCSRPATGCVVASAGNFGERWLKLARAYGIEPVHVEHEWGERLDPARIGAAAGEADTAAVFVTQSETSTGVVHDIEAIARAVAPTGALLVVDAVSSLGGVELATDAWGVDVAWPARRRRS